MEIKLTKKNLLLGLILAMVVVSCSEKDPLPLSNASFEWLTIAPERYQEVKFENLSSNAKTYEWDFGDGSAISTEIAPIHTYGESGDFIVSLKAYTEDDQVSTETKVLDIGERYLTGMYITNISPNDAEGNPWDDDGTGPDVLMQFGPVNFESEEEFEGFFIESLLPEDYNTAFGISTLDFLSENYKLTNEDFFILLEEVDTVLINQIDSAIYTPMIELQFNPVIVDGEAITEVKREDGTGDLTIPFIVVDEYHFFLEFEIR